MDLKNTKELQTWRWAGDLHKILCMQGGEDDVSYAKNSDATASAISLSKPFIIQSIQSMKLFKGEPSLRIADLGCATGFNTLVTIELLVESLRQRYYRECEEVPEFEAFFSDLPSNDFNTLFRSLPTLYDGKRKQHYYAAGVPGSFYHRLFPKRKLHMAVSLSALHWLSKVPWNFLLFFFSLFLFFEVSGSLESRRNYFSEIFSGFCLLGWTEFVKNHMDDRFSLIFLCWVMELELGNKDHTGSFPFCKLHHVRWVLL